MLIGTAVLTTLDILRSHKMLRPSPDTPIKNIPLVLSLFILFVGEWKRIGGGEDHGLGETIWLRRVVQMADEHLITIGGPFGTAKHITKIREEIKAEAEESGRDVGDDEFVLLKKEMERRDKLFLRMPRFDFMDENRGGPRKWKRWDWKREVS